MAYKGKVVSGTPERHIVYPGGNQGFNRKENTIGRDTVPGLLKGAPLSNAKQQMIDNKTIYHAGHGPTPGVLNDIPGDKTTMGFRELTDRSKSVDSPVSAQKPQMPDPKVITKADEARIAEDRIGNTPNSKGTLGR